MIRENFLILQKNIIYFDSSATTLKPYQVVNKITEYYNEYSSNVLRGDYNIAYKADLEYEKAREKVKKFINSKEEIIFTKNTTDSINIIVNSYLKKILKPKDEILISKTEHSSNILPFFNLKNKVNYITLNENFEITLENLKKSITKNTKIISIAHVTNTIGDERNIKEIIKLAHENNVLVLIDAAQSISTIKTDVEELDVDFLVFSSHKMFGPNGVGVLYSKYIKDFEVYNYGGGITTKFNSKKEVSYKDIPFLLEAGTPNIEGVIGLGEAIEFINQKGILNMRDYIKDLKQYCVKKLKTIKDIEIYNENVEGYTVLFNKKNIFSQDLAEYLNKKNICIRVGDHCAKLLKEVLNVNNTCRISFQIYNIKEEIDILINALKEEDILKKSLL